MSETTTANPSTIERAIETDLAQHVLDTFTVNAIRGGQLVLVSWEDLTPTEQRQACLNLFHLCDWEVA